MADQCIPANPDISGIGVRAAIYVQNLLCFAPVVAHLWDGKVSADEMSGVKDQSIGMLAIAFAILISTIIQVTSGKGQLITNFHAAVILDLSWMNNTSTFIWFLLYVHHRSGDDKAIPATWSSWAQHLLSPLRRPRESTGDSTKQDVAPRNASNTFHPVVQHLWNLVSQAPVLTLGSIHLSLMACVGIWLWSNPSSFGAPALCNPSLAIVGGAVNFSSRALRIWSLLVYSLLLIPGVNLVPGFLFFLSLHILYNKSRRRHPQFWTRLSDVRHIPRALRNTLRTLRRFPDNAFRRWRAFPSDEESQSGDSHRPIPFGAPSGTDFSLLLVNAVDSKAQGRSDHNPTPSQADSSIHLPSNLSITSFEIHFTFLVIGLVCLAIINLVFLVDIELTLSRNERIQSRGEDEWVFGQVLALLLLVVPLRDFLASIIDIRRKLREMRQDLQDRFEKALRQAIEEDTLVGHHFRDFIEQGADPNTQLAGRYLPHADTKRTPTNLLQITNLPLSFNLRRIK